VKGGGGVTEAKDGEGERQIDMGDEEMQTDMVCMAETDTPEILRVCPRENQAKPGKTRQEVIQLKSTILKRMADHTTSLKLGKNVGFGE